MSDSLRIQHVPQTRAFSMALKLCISLRFYAAGRSSSSASASVENIHLSKAVEERMDEREGAGAGASPEGGAAAGIVALLEQLKEEHIANEAKETFSNPGQGAGDMDCASEDSDEEGEALAALRKALASARSLAR
jgi:hypothetical protein